MTNHRKGTENFLIKSMSTVSKLKKFILLNLVLLSQFQVDFWTDGLVLNLDSEFVKWLICNRTGLLHSLQFITTLYLANIIVFPYAIILINVTRRVHILSFNGKNVITFFVIVFINILNSLLANSWNLRMKPFDSFSFYHKIEFQSKWKLFALRISWVE